MKTESITDAVSAVQESRTRMVVVAYQPNCSLTDFDAAAESEGWALLNMGSLVPVAFTGAALAWLALKQRAAQNA